MIFPATKFDVTGRTIRVSASDETVAHGSAVFGAVAAGNENGGYSNMGEAIEKMSCGYSRIYTPNPEKAEIYREKYRRYLDMSDLFSK